MVVTRIPVLLALVAAGALAAGPTATAQSRCATGSLPVTPKLATTDPTTLEDDPRALVQAQRGATVTDLLVQVRRGGTTVRSGRLTGRLSTRQTAVRLEPVAGRSVSEGRAQLVVTGLRQGCAKRTTRTRTWRFTAPSLPVRGTLVSTKTGDHDGAVHLLLRSVGRRRIATVRAQLLDRTGATVSEARVTAAFAASVPFELPLADRLSAGSYTLRLSGRRAGARTTQYAEQPLAFASGRTDAAPATAEPTTGERVQRAVVDWSGGKHEGREAAAFRLPGIGYGELVCRVDAQYVRVFPNDPGREVSQLAWTYRDWGEGQEKALREALHAPFTGPDFREGLNKFSPAEKRSTGEFVALVTDRGPFGSTGGPALAPPTSFRLTWVWDLSQPGNERCHAEVELVTEAAPEARPLARSAQVLWRGDADAAGRDVAAVDLPGVGRLTLTCQPGEAGVRRLDLDTPGAAAITTREGSEDPTVDAAAGPISTQLPNNGQVAIRLVAGQTLLVSSRWKTNDPDPAQNWCSVAAQARIP